MSSKFKKEIQSLLEHKVITSDVAERIDAYYLKSNKQSNSKLFTIFGVFGALLIGLGIILILAHNWDMLSKTTKTIFAFTPLIIGQLFAGFSIFKNKSSTWQEASGTFLFFSVGACIALIGQIYNLPGRLHEFLLTWILLCIPLVYLLKSKALIILCLVFTTYYACDLGYGFLTRHQEPWLYLVMLLALIPAYINLLKKNKTSNVVSILNWLFPISLIIVLGTFVNFSYGILLYVLLFGTFYNLGGLTVFYNQNTRRNGYLILGSLGTVVVLLMSSFHWLWNDIVVDAIYYNSNEVIISAILSIASVLLLYFTNFKSKARTFSLFQLAFAVFAILFFIASEGSVLSPVLINILLLALGINALIIGANKFHFGILNYGLLIITSVIVCRFFDTNISFVIRGLLFVLVGGGFFATNYIMLQKQRKNENLITK